MIDHYEDFTESQLKVLKRFVSNTSSNIFVLNNLPEVIKGALFSRYSRSTLGLRSLLLKEFILNEETAFSSIAGTEGESSSEGQFVAVKKAQNFYDRILDGYGDDSIGELGGAHLAIENISILATKAIEDCRIGGSPLEKSTRYVYFDQKIHGKYLYYREPVLLTSAFRDVYIKTCDALFETYSELIPPLTEQMERQYPKEPEVSKVAYTAALRAKVLDCLRGLLPASTLTNMGVFGNGRFFEMLIQKLHCQPLTEMQEIGKKSYQELTKVIPSFIRRADLGHRNQKSFVLYCEKKAQALKEQTKRHAFNLPRRSYGGVRLVSFDAEAPAKVAAALLYSHSSHSIEDLVEYCLKLPKEELDSILEAGSSFREHRRHKSPRALEHASYTFEIMADYGVYRDLHRHRMLTQDKQLLTCDYDYYTPSEILGTEMEKKYRDALDRAKESFNLIRRELPEEAQYIVPMAYHLRWYFHVNLRSLQWLCELRSAAAGHPSYRFIAQDMAKLVIAQNPEFERFFQFVDFEGYELGRLGQEIRSVEKLRERQG